MAQINSTAAGHQIGANASEKISFHGAAPVAQRAGAAQAVAVVAAGAAPDKAEFDAVVALANELRAALVEKGLIKGAA
jgi:hypothetical protein